MSSLPKITAQTTDMAEFVRRIQEAGKNQERALEVAKSYAKAHKDAKVYDDKDSYIVVMGDNNPVRKGYQVFFKPSDEGRANVKLVKDVGRFGISWADRCDNFLEDSNTFFGPLQLFLSHAWDIPMYKADEFFAAIIHRIVGIKKPSMGSQPTWESARYFLGDLAPKEVDLTETAED